MRKQEEERYKTRLEWVQAHQFPEDTIAEWHKEHGISAVYQGQKKIRKIYNRELLFNCRCQSCNFQNQGLHDKALLTATGNKTRLRSMYMTTRDKILCEYCCYPDKHFNELNEKSKEHVTDLGELLIAEAARNKTQKGLEVI